MKDNPSFKQIIETVNGKCAHKAQVMTHVVRSFASMRNEAELVAKALKEDCAEHCDTSLGFKNISNSQFQMMVGEDALIFNLHDDVFEIDPAHPVRKTSYLKDDGMRAFCGMVSIYNFLRTSLDKNRPEDVGYLIGRVFINSEDHFFVEGKKRLGFLYNDFSSQRFHAEAMREVVMSSILHCLEFDLQTPPYESFAALNVMQMQAINGTSGSMPSRPLGFHIQKPLDKLE
jgi:hypothetical protein